LAAEAVTALDRIGGDEAEAAIRAFVNSSAFMVRSVALDALERRNRGTALSPTGVNGRTPCWAHR
jgi:hypothetical protein